MKPLRIQHAYFPINSDVLKCSRCNREIQIAGMDFTQGLILVIEASCELSYEDLKAAEEYMLVKEVQEG